MKARSGEIWKVSDSMPRKEADFLYILFPSKKMPTPIEKRKATGLWIQRLEKTRFFNEEHHFKGELVVLKQKSVKVYKKYLIRRVDVKPFYFVLRDKGNIELEGKEINPLRVKARQDEELESHLGGEKSRNDEMAADSNEGWGEQNEAWADDGTADDIGKNMEENNNSSGQAWANDKENESNTPWADVNDNEEDEAWAVDNDDNNESAKKTASEIKNQNPVENIDINVEISELKINSQNRESDEDNDISNLTLRFMILKNSLFDMQEGWRKIWRSKNGTPLKSLFDSFVRRILTPISKTECDVQVVRDPSIKSLEHYGIVENEILTNLDEYINPKCSCSRKGFHKKEKLYVCVCKRIYHFKCAMKRHFRCQKCASESSKMVKLTKRSASDFDLSKIDFKADLKKYQKENAALAKGRTVLRTHKEISRLRSAEANLLKKGKDRRRPIEIDVDKNSKARELANLKEKSARKKRLSAEDQALRLVEIYKLDNYNLQLKELPNPDRESVRKLLYKCLAQSVCECFDYLRRLDRYLKHMKHLEEIKLSASSKSFQRKIKKKKTSERVMRAVRWAQQMKRSRPTVYQFLKNLYDSALLQPLLDAPEKDLICYLHDLATKIEKTLRNKWSAWGVGKRSKYHHQVKLLTLNLGNKDNLMLRLKVGTKQLTYRQISELEEEDLVNEIVLRQIERSKEEFWKEREVRNEVRYIIKNHKGDFEVKVPETVGGPVINEEGEGEYLDEFIEKKNKSDDENEDSESKSNNQNKKKGQNIKKLGSGKKRVKRGETKRQLGIRKKCDSLKERRRQYREKLKAKLKDPQVYKFNIFKENNQEICENQFTKNALNLENNQIATNSKENPRNANETINEPPKSSNAFLLNPKKAFQMKKGEGNRYDLEEALEEFQMKNKPDPHKFSEVSRLNVFYFFEGPQFRYL